MKRRVLGALLTIALLAILLDALSARWGLDVAAAILGMGIVVACLVGAIIALSAADLEIDRCIQRIDEKLAEMRRLLGAGRS